MEASTERSWLQRVRAWLPRGDTLDDAAFRERHRTLSILLALHVPVLTVFGTVRGLGFLHALAESAVAGVFLGFALIPRMPRRMKGILVSAGLVWCSAIAVHFSGGVIEAHFHFFVILGFIALYQDWAAFGWAIVFTALSHGVGSQLAPDLMYNHDAAIQRPWTWALIHAGMVLFAAVGQVIGWRHAERSQDRATALSTQLVREQAERQASYSRLYVNLARRTQSLLHRQLSLIDELEDREEDPETLSKLFALDHLATRVRRNAESLLVMAGQSSPRRLDASVPLAEVARAAASEVEQYQRVEVRVDAALELDGTAVVDVTHLLAELIENATEYSPPTTPVIVAGRRDRRGAIVTIEDHGIGLSDEELRRANATLQAPPELDEEVVRHLGFQVVGRLAGKLALHVTLQATPGGGITAVVVLPPALLRIPSEDHVPADVEVPALAGASATDATAAASAQNGVGAPPPAPAASQPDEAILYPALVPRDAAPADLSSAANGDTPSGNGAAPSGDDGRASRPQPTAAWTAGAPPSATNHDIDPLFDRYFAPPTSPPAAPADAPPTPLTRAATSASDRTPSGLPRRQPAASLPEELRGPPDPYRRALPPPSPPEARQALSAFQAGGRAARSHLGPVQGEPQP